VILIVSLIYRAIGKPQLIQEREEKATPVHLAIQEKIRSLNDKEKTLRHLERRMRLTNNDSLQKIWQALALIQQHRAIYEVALWHVDLQLWLARLSPITQAWHSIHTEQACARYQRLITSTQDQGERMLAQWQTQRASVVEGQAAADAPLLCNTPQAKQYMQDLKTALALCNTLMNDLLAKEAAIVMHGLHDTEHQPHADNSDEACEQLYQMMAVSAYQKEEMVELNESMEEDLIKLELQIKLHES